MSASFNQRRRPRRGYTLIELLVSMSTGALLLAGLTSSLYISTKSLTPDATATSESNRSSIALARITADLRLALNFTERTATALAFTVPDRTDDGAVDTIRYSWSGTPGDPLLYQFNDGDEVAVVTDVKHLKFPSLTRTIPAAPTPLPIVAHDSPSLPVPDASEAESLLIEQPKCLVPGDFMIAVVVVVVVGDGSVAASMKAPDEWTMVTPPVESENISTAVWWKFAEASDLDEDEYEFSWEGDNAYGWIMRFSEVDSNEPINDWDSSPDVPPTSPPTSPSVTTTVPNAMIVRIGGFYGNSITVDDEGEEGDEVVAGHTTLMYDRRDGSEESASGAAAYVVQPSAGPTGPASFTLTEAEEYVTFTLALTPDNGS